MVVVSIGYDKLNAKICFDTALMDQPEWLPDEFTIFIDIKLCTVLARKKSDHYDTFVIEIQQYMKR